MGKIASLTPNRMDVRVDDKGRWVNLQFHQKDDHIDVIFNRSQIPFLIEQLQKVTSEAAQAE